MATEKQYRKVRAQKKRERMRKKAKTNRVLAVFLALMLVCIGGVGILAIHYYTSDTYMVLNGDEHMTVGQFGIFKDPGVTAKRGYIDVTDSVETDSDVDITEPGDYTITYRSGNFSTQRTVTVLDHMSPALELKGKRHISMKLGDKYKEPGYTATDNADGDISDRVQVTGEVDPKTPGEYKLVYSVEDSRHNRTEVVRSITVERKHAGTVYLTFDDGPSKYTRDLLDILAKYDVKVTFFVVNYGYNDVIGEEYAAGHSVGVHSATHDFHAIYASEEAFFEDLQVMNDIVYNQTGAYADIIRFPGGSSNTISSFNPGIMTRLAEAVTERGYQYFDWNVSAGDAGETTDPDQVYQNVIDGIQQHETSVVLMHDSKSYTVEAVERILLWCIENGYDLRPLTKDSPASHHRISN